MERVESQEAGFPPFPPSLEIPSGLPHSHSLDCWNISDEQERSNARPSDLKGVVMEVLDPKCNERSGILTTFPGSVYDLFDLHVVGIHGKCEAGDPARHHRPKSWRGSSPKVQKTPRRLEIEIGLSLRGTIRAVASWRRLLLSRNQ